jgi:putative transposase
MRSVSPRLSARPTALYATLGNSPEQRHSAQRRLFADVLSDELLAHSQSLNGGFVLGNQRFEREIAAMLGRRTGKGSPGRPKRVVPDDRQAEMAV